VNLLLQRHPINSALSLVVVMMSLAVLYWSLGAEFLAAAQVIVYSGAIMVLFVFVIMLLNAGEEERTHGSRAAYIVGIPRRRRHLLPAQLRLPLGTHRPRLFHRRQPRRIPRTTSERPQPVLFTELLLPFEVTSILILVAILGARRGRSSVPSRGRSTESCMVVPIAYYLVLSRHALLHRSRRFLIKRNIITVFMSIELMLNAVNLTFVAFAAHVAPISGQIFVFFVMVVAAAEAAVGLAIIIAIFRTRRPQRRRHRPDEIYDPNLHLWLIPLLPFAGFLINGTLGRKLPRASSATVALSHRAARGIRRHGGVAMQLPRLASTI
jgi:NADH-quinone oxidoreductase subunit J